MRKYYNIMFKILGWINKAGYQEIKYLLSNILSIIIEYWYLRLFSTQWILRWN